MLPPRPPGEDRATRAGEVVDPDTVLTRPAVGQAPRIVSTLRLPRRRRGREIVAVLDPVRARPVAGDHQRSDQQVVEAAAERLTAFLQPGELVAATDDGRLRLRLRREDRDARPERLQAMAYHAVEALEALDRREDDAPAVLDLGVGWAPVTRSQDAHQALEHAASAAAESVRQRDLQPRQEGHHLRVRRPRIDRWSTGNQVLVATVGAVVVPYLALVAFSLVGLDLSGVLYWAIVGSLALTAGMIWAETSHALDPPRPTGRAGERPRATAVIAAYLPNEADTILETVEHFLSLPDREGGPGGSTSGAGGLQVVLAYNTPYPLPVEDELARLGEQHDDLVVLKVPDSTSKAQNVNAALHVADGELIGIFDADHHPMPGAFDRAWQWLGDPEDPADVVQGHCVIRNGETGWLARLVAVEFEQIYAVAHPGRAALAGFGIFGGSNGFWRASALERIRLRGSFLTEDIEASMRVLGAGGRIVNDPGLLSRELAPETPEALWKQRMRWAQGWFQVSLRHLGPILRSPALTLRQKIGATYLLGWREVYPWMSILTWPLLGFLAWRDGGLDLGSPLFLLITLLVTVSGPLQTLAAYRLATPEVRRHRRWFLQAALLNLVFYTEAKNLVNRVAQLKQLRGEHQWVVTPRTAGGEA